MRQGIPVCGTHHPKWTQRRNSDAASQAPFGRDRHSLRVIYTLG